MRVTKILAVAICAVVAQTGLSAQQMLSLQQCREMAIENNQTLEQARIETEMARFDRKVARANYYPNISALGAYQYSTNEISLISDEQSAALQNLGSSIQSSMSSSISELFSTLLSDPTALTEYSQSAMWQGFVSGLSSMDMSEALNQIGAELDDALHLDSHNIFIAGVSLSQPIYMGGKIVQSNRVAGLAEELSRAQYDQKYQELLVTVDKAYWQIVSVANKKKMAEDYVDLLRSMEHDTDVSYKAGTATTADVLQVKVQANEAAMLKTKADNALILAKMLLCKEIGIDLLSDITLEDENLDEIPLPSLETDKEMEEIFDDRPETRGLSLAVQIYDGKAKIAKADMLPSVAFTANFLMTNPSFNNGFESKFHGFVTVGASVSVPIFHGFEARMKTRKAEAEARLYRSQWEDAKNLINLEVSQLRQQRDEAYQKLTMAKSNLDCAQENLRTATVGYEAGVVDTNTALSAHTAWLEARSEFIDAGIELQMNSVNLGKAQGNSVPME